MVRTFFIILLLSLLTLYTRGQNNRIFSCYFQQPQPTQLDSTAIDSTFLGNYVDTKDSLNEIDIRDSSIYSLQWNVQFMTTSKLDTIDSLFTKDEAIHGMWEEPLPYAKSSDTLFFYYPRESRIFRISDTQILKQTDSTLHLNYKVATGKWSTMLIKKDKKGRISFWNFDHVPVMEKIREFEGETFTDESDRTNLIISPSQSEYMGLIKSKAFQRSRGYFKFEPSE